MPRKDPHPASWLPPFAVGAAGAVSGEVAVGLLLYSGGGFLRALTVLLATLLGAFAGGMWSAPSETGGERAVEDLRKRWLLLLLSFVLAAVTSALWTFTGGLASGAVTRGLGLAFLAALPLFASGSLLGTMAAARRSAGVPGPGTAAAAGAAIGIVLTGLVVVPRLTPSTTYLFCLAGLSAAALVHGRVLDGRVEGREVESVPSPWGRLVVEEGLPGRNGGTIRRVVEGARVRGGRDRDGRPLRRWEEVVPALVPPGGPVLVVGGGASEALTGLTDRDCAVEVTDRNQELVTLTRRHLGPLDRPEEVLRTLRWPGSLEALTPVPARSGLILDRLAVSPGDRVPVPSRAAVDAMAGTLGPAGVLLVVGLDPDGLEDGPLQGLAAALAHRFPRIALYRGEDEVVVAATGLLGPDFVDPGEGWSRTVLEPGGAA